MKEEKISKNFNYEFGKRPMIDQDSSFFDINNSVKVKIESRETMGIHAESPNNNDQKMNLDD